MEEMIPITITIADRNYRIKVEAQNEELVRKTIKFLNDKVHEFKQNYAGKDMQDYVSMVMAWYATQDQAVVAQHISEDTVQKELNSIEAMIDKALT